MHISDIITQSNIFSKLEPLASHIRNISKKLYIPASDVAVDKMIVWFSGRSAHTFRIKNKPTPEGYKILSLCDLGYTYTFMFSSRIESSNVNSIENVNKIGAEVFHLVSQLLLQKSFNIYMNNYFSSINLFLFFWKKGIRACGTIKTNTSKFPITLKKEKKKNKWMGFSKRCCSG